MEGGRSVGATAGEPCVVEGGGVALQLLPGLLGELCSFCVGRHGAHGAEAAVGARWLEGSIRRPAGGEVGRRRGAEGLRVGKVDASVEEACLRLGLVREPGVVGGVEAWRAGNRAGHRGLLKVGQAARFGAVGGAIGLLVAAEAELVCPGIGHGKVWRCGCDVCVYVRCVRVESSQAESSRVRWLAGGEENWCVMATVVL